MDKNASEELKVREGIMAAVNREIEKRKKEPRQKPVNTERLLARTERDIAALEAKIAELDALEAENSSNYQKLLELSEQRVVLQAELDRLYEKWEELAQ